MVPKRSSSQTIRAKGIYPGAEVVRGPDWTAEYKDQDGKDTFSAGDPKINTTYNPDDDD